MFAHMTVKEVVHFHVDLCQRRISGVEPGLMYAFPHLILKELGLEHVMDTKIGGPDVRGISGGQKRRVTLARGLCSRAA